MIDALEKQYKLEALKEIVVDLYKDQFSAKREMLKIQDDYNSALEKERSIQSKIDAIEEKIKRRAYLEDALADGNFEWDEYDAMLAELDSLTEALDGDNGLCAALAEYKTQVSGAHEVTENIGKQLDEAKNKYDDFGKKIDEVNDEITETMRKSGASSGKAWIEEFEKNTSMIGRLLAKSMTDGFYFDLTTSGGKLAMKTRTITAYAEGGFPDRGEMFVANENGAEYIGAIGNRTAVANNDQIVKGITYGVASGNDPVVAAIYGMAAQIVSAIEENSGNITIGDEVIGRAAKRYDRDSGINTSQGAFAYAR